MTKTEDLLAGAKTLLARGEELVRHWDENWLSRTMSREETITYYTSTSESITRTLRQIKLVREALAAAESPSESAETAARLYAMRNNLIVIRARADTGVKQMTTPFVPKDPERYAQGLREAAEGKAIPAEEVRKWFLGRNG